MNIEIFVEDAVYVGILPLHTDPERRIFRAGGRLAEAEGRMFQPAGLAGHTVGDGKGPSSNRSDFFAMRCTLSTT